MTSKMPPIPPENQSRKGSNAQRDADVNLTPVLLGKIDGEEWPEGRQRSPGELGAQRDLQRHDRLPLHASTRL